MIVVTPDISLEENELQLKFIQATGPGGQNVNKVATAVQLRFNVAGTNAFSEAVKARLVKLAGKRMTNDGELLIEARRHRTQERNREDAIARLGALIAKAAVPPTPRRKTKPSKAARKKRLDEKRQKSEIKKTRRPLSRSNDE